MRTDRHIFRSRELGEDFEIRVYGSAGKPVMAFPSSKGHVPDFEAWGMVEAAQPFIDAGDVVIVAVDSRDERTWFADTKDNAMARLHRAWELCVTREVPRLLCERYGWNERFVATGCSWGGYHATNFALKFPEVFDVAISLSGAYTLRHAVGHYADEWVYFNDILAYLPGLTDPAILERLRESYFILCHGLGAWEECNHEAGEVASLLRSKGITCWHDVWGTEWPHDWPSWRRQFPKFLGALSEGVFAPGLPDQRISLLGPRRAPKPLLSR
jgi:esterase/lipase superfamily enzyme